jgi:hypothetical protein
LRSESHRSRANFRASGVTRFYVVPAVHHVELVHLLHIHIHNVHIVNLVQLNHKLDNKCAHNNHTAVDNLDVRAISTNDNVDNGSNGAICVHGDIRLHNTANHYLHHFDRKPVVPDSVRHQRVDQFNERSHSASDHHRRCVFPWPLSGWHDCGGRRGACGFCGANHLCPTLVVEKA